LITLVAHALNQEKQQNLSNRHTNWDGVRRLINERLTLTGSHKAEEDTEATVKFNDIVQWADWTATPEHATTHKAHDCPILIK
jgi:hypothetical protein